MSQETTRLREVLEQIAAAPVRLSAEELRNMAGMALVRAPESEAPFDLNPHIAERLEDVQDLLGEAHEQIEDWDQHVALAKLDYAIDNLILAIMQHGDTCYRCQRPLYECTCSHTPMQMIAELNQQIAACIPDDFGVTKRK